MTWLLDTNALIHAMRGRPAAVERRLEEKSVDDVCITTINVAEIEYGILKSKDPGGKRSIWRTFLAPFQVLSFDYDAAVAHAEIRYALRNQPIGERDLFIAAIAISRGLTVVSQNVREFSRVPGLQIEDWSID